MSVCHLPIMNGWFFVGIHFFVSKINSPMDSIQESIINHAKDKVTPITSAHIPNLPRWKSHVVEIFQRFPTHLETRQKLMNPKSSFQRFEDFTKHVVVYNISFPPALKMNMYPKNGWFLKWTLFRWHLFIFGEECTSLLARSWGSSCLAHGYSQVPRFFNTTGVTYGWSTNPPLTYLPEK